MSKAGFLPQPFQPKLINGYTPEEYRLVEARLNGKAAPTFPYDELNSWQYNKWSQPAGPLYTGDYYGTDYNYAVEAGDLIDNAAAMACMLWICRTFPEAPLVVKRVATDSTEKIIPRHAMAQKVRRPNPYYSGMLLWNATLLSFNWNGNAYWRKVRNSAGQVLELYWEPHWNMRPVRTSASDFITRYEIWRDREWRPVPLEDVVHFRYGIDPRNDMCGLSPLASALREVYTDNQAARYASAMFRNRGVIGGLITPKDPNDDLSSNAVRIKQELGAVTTGDNVGQYVVLNAPVDLTFPPSDPSKMDTRGNRKITEERISALLGVPAIVAGLGAGLDRSTFANMAEAREAAYEGNIIPTQAMLADELDIQLLPDFGNPDVEQTGWDYSQVRVLQADEAKKAQTWAILYNAGLVTRKDARADMNLPYDDVEDDVYKGQSAQAAQLPTDAQQSDLAVAEQPVAVPQTEPVKALSLPVHTNGNGHKE